MAQLSTTAVDPIWLPPKALIWQGGAEAPPKEAVFFSNMFYIGGGFKYILFSPLFGEDSHFDYYFSDGLKPPTSVSLMSWDGRKHDNGKNKP